MYEQILDKVKKECVAHNVVCETCKYNCICKRFNITPFGADTYISFLIDIAKES